MKSHFLPANWVFTTVGAIYDVIGGGTPSTEIEAYWSGNIPWITSADILGLHNISTSRYVTLKGVHESTTNIVPPGSLLVVTRVGLGKIAISKKSICFSQDIQGLVHSTGLIRSEYALFYLSYELQRLKFQARGTTIPGLTKKQLKDTKIPLSPYNEQLRILSKIEELFSELEKGLENIKAAREQIKVYRQSVLKHAFEGKLTAEWRKQRSRGQWKQTSFDFLLSYLTSGSRGWAKYYSDDGDIFIRAQNLKHDRLDLDDIAYVQLPEKSEGMRTRVQVGDLLITITGANVTKTAYVHKDLGNAYVSQHVALCRLKAIADTEFLYWYLIGESAGRKQLKELAYGAGKPGLNLDNIRSVKIQLPELDEQKFIVQKINELLSIEASLTSAIESEIQRAESLRQSILKKAFSGRLVPQDPNDEPASVLLERIRAEKATQSIKSRTRKRKPSKEVA